MEPAWRLKFIDGFKFTRSAFISILSHTKCVNDQGTKLDGINVPQYGSMVTKHFSSHSQMTEKVYATKIYPYLLMTRLACDQLRAYFLCHNYVPVFYHQSWLHSCQIDGRTDGQTDKVNPVYPPPNQLHWSGGYDNIQIVLPLMSDPVSMQRMMPIIYLYVYIYIYIYIYKHNEPRTSQIKHTSLNSADDVAV